MKKLHLFSIVTLILLLSVATSAFALGPFTPSETQDPLCLPTDPDCYVLMPDTFWEAATTPGDIHYSGGNVGIGTDNPIAPLTIIGNNTNVEGEDILGPELITNGTFTGNADGWYLYDDAGGSAFYNDNNVSVYYTGVESSTSIYADTGFVLESGKTYELSFDISNATDDVYFYFDNTTDADCPDHCIPIDSTDYSDVSYGDGHHTFTFTSGYDGTDALTFDSYNQNPNTGWTIDNVSLREILPGGGPSPIFTVSSSDTPFFSAAGNSLYLGDTTSAAIWGAAGRAKLNILAGNSSVGKFYLNDGISVSFASMTGHDDGDGDIQQADGWGYSCLGPSDCSDPDDFVFTSALSNSLDDAEFSGVYTGPTIGAGYMLGFSAMITEEGDMDVFSWEETLCSTNPMVRCISGNLGSGSYSIDTVRAYDSLDTAISVVDENTNGIFIVQNNGGFSLGHRLDGNDGNLSVLHFNNDEEWLTVNAQLRPLYGIIDSTDSLGGAGQVLSTDGDGNLVWIDGITLLTDGIPNAVQNTLNLLSGSNILITDNGDGSVTIDADLSASPITLDSSNTLLSSAITTGSVPESENSIFLGVDAGKTSSLSSDSAVSIGNMAGFGAYGTSYNFIGAGAGSAAINIINSNFIGTNTGMDADGASHSNFFGFSAGREAADASFSNLFGYNTGRSFVSNSIGSNNIIIGTNISLPNATANSINFGGVLFGANTYSTTTGDPSIAAVMNGRIGIATIPTTYTLEVGNSSVAGVVAHFTNSTGYCDINPTTISLTCSSDSTLKKNITTIGDTLDSLLTLNPVTYNWNTESDTDDKHIGFIAQEVEQIYPDLVSTDQNGLKSLNYTGLIPYTIKAIQEINLNIIGIRDLTTENTWRDSLISWFADTANGIQSLVVHDEICIDGQCLTRDDIRFLLELKAVQQGGDIHDDTPNNDTPLETEQETPEETPASVEIQTEPETPAEEPAVQEESIPTLEPTATPLEGTV